jgi:LuxR family maltose regulon positive regulatory protein
MAETFSIIQTKLHRPPLPRDLVERPRLTSLLDCPPQRPLTLVSAPAGYGKSTLISCWAEMAEALGYPLAWISLDNYDNDPAVLLNYIVAAIQSLFPDSCSDILRVLQAPDLPSPATLAAVLINDLNRLPRIFSLVLDDYHLLHHVEVLEMIRLVVKHSHPNMNLIIVSRTDPFLPLPRLRLAQQLLEIREHDLRFSNEEARVLLQMRGSDKLDEKAVAELNRYVEGWAAGLCLETMSLQLSQEVSLLAKDLHGETKDFVIEYLFNEVMVKQSPGIQQLLLRSAFVERFCADLCDELVNSDAGTPAQALIDEIKQSNLFLVDLDEVEGWYRYHHLFRQMLQRRAYQELGKEEIQELQNRAGRWFAQNGLVDEALSCLLAANNMNTAASIIEENSRNLLNRLERRVLEHWLDLLPDEIVWQRPRLLVAKAWLFYRHWRISDLASVLDQLEQCLTQNAANLAATERLFIRGQINALQSATYYIYVGDPQKSMVAAEQALSYLPASEQGARGTAMGYWALSLQAQGDEETAVSRLQQAVDNPAPLGPASIQLYLALSFIHWTSGNLVAMKQTAERFLVLSEKLPQATAPACWVSGIYHYERNQLDAAQRKFEETVALHYSTNFVAACDSWLALARICQERRDFAQAQAHLDAVRAETLRLESRDLLPVIDAVQAYQWLLQGDTDAAMRWAQAFDPERSPEWTLLTFMPYLFWVRILVAHGPAPELRIVQQSLLLKLMHAQAHHFTRFALQLLTHLALVQLKLGDRNQTLRSLEKALRLAQPGGFIRSIVDADAAIKPLLEQLSGKEFAPHYLEQLTAAFSENGRAEGPQSAPVQEMATLLTLREKEILQRMQDGLNNTEIAQELVISVYTVKRHASNIYRKLEVDNRREAVFKAQQTGILTLD